MPFSRRGSNGHKQLLGHANAPHHRWDCKQISNLAEEEGFEPPNESPR
jgi:hypothetical protein